MPAENSLSRDGDSKNYEFAAISSSSDQLRINNNDDFNRKNGYGGNIIDSDKKDLVDLSRCAAYDLLRSRKKEFIRNHLRKYKPFVSKRWHSPKKEVLEKEFDTILKTLFNDDNCDSDKTFLQYFIYEIEQELQVNYYSIYNSLNSHSIFGSTQNGCIPWIQDPKIEDIYLIGKTNLKDEVSILPCPESVTDVLRLREKKEIHSFRNAVGNWLEVLREGNEKLEKKMRSDIRKANQQLKKLEKWKAFETSQVNFWIGIILDWVPIVDKLFSSVQVFGKLYEIKTLRKYGWIQMAKT